MLLKTGPRALQEAPPFLSKDQGLRWRNGKIKERSSVISVSERHNGSTADHTRTFGVSCELCRWVELQGKVACPGIASCFWLFAKRERSSKGFYVHGLSMGQVSRLNDLLVINLYRSDDPSVLQWLKHYVHNVEIPLWKLRLLRECCLWL